LPYERWKTIAVIVDSRRLLLGRDFRLATGLGYPIKELPNHSEWRKRTARPFRVSLRGNPTVQSRFVAVYARCSLAGDRPFTKGERSLIRHCNKQPAINNRRRRPDRVVGRLIDKSPRTAPRLCHHRAGSTRIASGRSGLPCRTASLCTSFCFRT
jgi:hypothetical protein